jgi:hypothetical protein
MRTPILILAAAAGVAFASPAFAIDTLASIQNSPQLVRADMTGKAIYFDELSSATKKAKKKTGKAKRGWWGG